MDTQKQKAQEELFKLISQSFLVGISFYYYLVGAPEFQNLFKFIIIFLIFRHAISILGKTHQIVLNTQIAIFISILTILKKNKIVPLSQFAEIFIIAIYAFASTNSDQKDTGLLTASIVRLSLAVM